MIEYGERNIFLTGAECIVNPVNCQVDVLNKMGKPQAGLAGGFEAKFPKLQEGLRRVCQNGSMGVGKVFFQRVDSKTKERSQTGDLYVANVATKNTWGESSKLDPIVRGVKILAEQVEIRGIKSIAIPKLGCGYGKLNWSDVQLEIHKAFAPLAEKGVKVMVLGQDVNNLSKSDKIQSHAKPVDEVRKYAGIGARETPPDVLKKMEVIGYELARAGIKLRSGGAIGADSAFEKGAVSGEGEKEIFFAFPKHNGRSADGKDFKFNITKAHYALAQKYYDQGKIPGKHKMWNESNDATKNLMARNGSQVLGEYLDDPSDLVLCYTKSGGVMGGTGQAQRIAADNNIPEINLGAAPWKQLDGKTVAAAAIRVIRKEASIEDVQVEYGALHKKKTVRRSTQGYDR